MIPRLSSRTGYSPTLVQKVTLSFKVSATREMGPLNSQTHASFPNHAPTHRPIPVTSLVLPSVTEFLSEPSQEAGLLCPQPLLTFQRAWVACLPPQDASPNCRRGKRSRKSLATQGAQLQHGYVTLGPWVPGTWET